LAERLYENTFDNEEQAAEDESMALGQRLAIAAIDRYRARPRSITALDKPPQREAGAGIDPPSFI
jgi:hypothetical protein